MTERVGVARYANPAGIRRDRPRTRQRHLVDRNRRAFCLRRPARARPIRIFCNCCAAARDRCGRARRGRCRSRDRARWHKARAGARPHRVAKILRHFRIGKHERLAVGELEGAHVERVGAAVLAQGRAAHAVAAAALVGAEIFQPAQRCAEFVLRRRHVLAHPLRDHRRHRAAQRRGRRDRDFARIRQNHALQPHGVRRAAFARRDQFAERLHDRDLGQPPGRNPTALTGVAGVFFRQRSEGLLGRGDLLRNCDRPGRRAQACTGLSLCGEMPGRCCAIATWPARPGKRRRG